MSLSASRTTVRSKFNAGVLALVLGWLGAHAWYLGWRRARWLSVVALLLLVASQTVFASRWENPAFLALFVPAAVGFIDGLRLCLMPDAVFNARYNPDLPPVAQMGWPVVCLTVVLLLVGAVVTLFGIAMINLYVWQQMGWLDGYVL